MDSTCTFWCEFCGSDIQLNYMITIVNHKIINMTKANHKRIVHNPTKYKISITNSMSPISSMHQESNADSELDSEEDEEL